MNWILVLTFSYGSSVSITSIPVATEKLCYKAGEKYTQEMKKQSAGSTNFVCMFSGGVN